MYYYNTGLSDDTIKNQNLDDYNRVFYHINDQKPYRCLALDFLEISYAPDP
jgi:hypothetical protein